MLGLLVALTLGITPPNPHCRPTHPSPRRWEKTGPSHSIGRPANGSLENASRIPEDGEFVKVLPARHKARHLNYASDALVGALQRAAKQVAAKYPGAILWVGNSAAPYGGTL